MAFQVGNVAVTTTAAQLVAAGGGKGVFIMNNGPNAITLGVDATVTTGNGFIVAAGTTQKFYPGDAAIFAIAATANQVSPADTRFWVEV